MLKTNIKILLQKIASDLRYIIYFAGGATGEASKIAELGMFG